MDAKVKFQMLRGNKSEEDKKKDPPIIVNLVEGNFAPVYSQGRCGNCYAYAQVDGLNIHNLVKKRNIPRLSIQQLTDCSSDPNLMPHNWGCDGGLFHISNIFMLKTGLNSMMAYPFNIETITEGTNAKCSEVKKKEPTFKISYWHDIWT